MVTDEFKCLLNYWVIVVVNALYYAEDEPFFTKGFYPVTLPLLHSLATGDTLLWGFVIGSVSVFPATSSPTLGYMRWKEIPENLPLYCSLDPEVINLAFFFPLQNLLMFVLCRMLKGFESNLLKQIKRHDLLTIHFQIYIIK